MTPELYHNLHYQFLIKFIDGIYKAGDEIPQDLIDDIIEVGKKAGIPEDQINVFRLTSDDDGAIIH